MRTSVPAHGPLRPCSLCARGSQTKNAYARKVNGIERRSIYQLPSRTRSVTSRGVSEEALHHLVLAQVEGVPAGLVLSALNQLFHVLRLDECWNFDCLLHSWCAASCPKLTPWCCEMVRTFLRLSEVCISSSQAWITRKYVHTIRC